MSEKKDCPQDYTGLCERVARLEVKMNIIGFLASASLLAAVATLFKLILR